MFLRGVRDWGVGGAVILTRLASPADWDASIVLDGATLVLEVKGSESSIFLQFDLTYKTPASFQDFLIATCSKLKAYPLWTLKVSVYAVQLLPIVLNLTEGAILQSRLRF